MKTSLIGLVILISAMANAGGSGEGSVDTTVFTCSGLSPVKEGVATASLHLSAGQLKMAYSNHVNDFNVSFEPIKVIASIRQAAELKVQHGLIVIESLNKNLSITLDPIDLLSSAGTVTGDFEVNGQAMQGSCSVNLNNLRLALN
jgi:hypothetical protein